MNGWQRFGLLILGCVAVMILVPDFDTPGWMFILFTLLVGAAVLLILSVISNLFAIYRFETINKLVTLAVIGLIVYTLLWHFPLISYKTPIEQLKAGKHPTQADVKRGLTRLTFNFDFVHRNVRRQENFSHQELNKNKQEQAKQPAPAKKEEQEDIELLLEE